MKILSTTLIAGTLVIATTYLLFQSPGMALQQENEPKEASVQSALNHSRKLIGIGRGFQTNTPEVQEAKRNLRELIHELQKAAKEDRLDEIEEDLKDGLKNFYGAQIEVHETHLLQLEEKVDAMRKKIESRREATEEIIDLRTKLLIRQAELGELNVLTELGRYIDAGPGLNPFGHQRLLFDGGPGSSSFPELDPFAQSSVTGIPSPPSPGSPQTPNVASAGLGFLHPDAPDAPPSPGLLAGIGESRSEFATVVFVTENELRDGKLSIKNLTNKRSRTSISFDDGADDLETKLVPGKYSYRYVQDGEVWGEGEFLVKNTGMLVIEIETGEIDFDLAEHRKENVTFDTGSKTLDGVLWVRGMNSDYNEREFTGKFDGQLNFSYLPGEYIFIVTTEQGAMSAKTFTVKPGEDLEVTIFEDDEESGDEEIDN